MRAVRSFFLLIGWLVSFHVAAIELTNVWSLKVGNENNSSPALSPDGILYFGSEYELYAVGTNRFIKWKFKTGLDIKSSPAIAEDGTIYFGSRDRKFYAITPEGKLKWSFATDGWVDSSPAIGTDGTIYVGSWDRKFYALNPDGTKKWVSVTAGEIESSPAIGADGTIYFGSHDKKLYALKPDGTKKWEFLTGGPIISSPAIDFSGKIYFSSVDGQFYVLNPDGTLAWSVRTGGITESSPVLGKDNSIYLYINEYRSAISPDHKVHLNAIIPDYLVDTTPAIDADGMVIYTSPDGNFSALGPDGLIRAQIQINKPSMASPVLAPDGMAYTTVFFGSLEAVKGPGQLMNSAWPMFRANLRHTGVVNTPPR